MPAFRIPRLCTHKQSGRAYVTLNGKQHYLGKAGTPEAKNAYERFIKEWVQGGGVTRDLAGRLLVSELVLRYLEFAKGYYSREGEPTNEYTCLRSALHPLVKLYGGTWADEFGPMKLKTVRNEFVRAGDARCTVNDKTHRVKRAFRWATENELLDPAILHGLDAVKGLRLGRTTARESQKVKPVTDQQIEAVLPLVAPQIQAMIRLQYWTGMRPGEVVQMRMADLDLGGKVWVYRPQRHKTEHLGCSREIPIGPKAQEILRPWLRADPESFLFSPKEAEEERNRERRAARKTKVQPSQRNRRRRSPKVAPGDAYTTNSYRSAITRACKILASKDETRGFPIWSPNQLRHTAATRLRREYGIETARVILGHTSSATTEIYAEVDRQRAFEAAGKAG